MVAGELMMESIQIITKQLAEFNKFNKAQKIHVLLNFQSSRSFGVSKGPEDCRLFAVFVSPTLSLWTYTTR